NSRNEIKNRETGHAETDSGAIGQSDQNRAKTGAQPVSANVAAGISTSSANSGFTNAFAFVATHNHTRARQSRRRSGQKLRA
ncbi:MAG TPA: hypothetical protein PKD31_08125, partial [Blastocatellia bacterium]|nr:hypothetical protein [Blastocatellia bacterium]